MAVTARELIPWFLILPIAIAPPMVCAQSGGPSEITMSVSSTFVSAGGSVEVSWDAPDADRCLASGAWLGVKEASGREEVGPMGEPSNIALTCFKGRLSAQASIDVAVLYPTSASRTKPYIAVEVFYATDRKKVSRTDDFWYSDDDWSDATSYGIAEVSIPDVHRPGELERPVWWKLQFRENPDKHVTLRSYAELNTNDFFRRLGTATRLAGRSEAFIFVHGFNVDLDDALRRTAQLVYDLRLESVPITYSWPSKGRGVAGYTTAENNALKSVDHFKEFLLAVRQRASVDTVNVLAHSMGNRIVVDALHELGDQENRPVVSHVLLAAPDVDAELFENEIVPVLSSSASTTMYSSSGDKALALSEKVHGEPRAGSMPLVIKGMDTVDSSDIDMDVLGHSYYAEALLQDIFYIVHHGIPASQRNLIRKRSEDGRYWALPR